MRVSPHSEAVAFDWAAAVRLLSAFNRHQDNFSPKTVSHAVHLIDIRIIFRQRPFLMRVIHWIFTIPKKRQKHR